MRTANFEQLLGAVPKYRVEQAQSYWADRTLFDVYEEMPVAERHGFADIVVVEPDTGYLDETKTLVMPLEYAQGYTAPHYMRAKVLQQYVAPDSRVVMMPNSTFGAKHVDLKSALTKEQMRRLKNGDYMPYGQVLMDTLEEADAVHNLGELGLIGSSQAGVSVLSIAAAGSNRLSVGKVTAIETPSKTDRGFIALAKDFTDAGSLAGDLEAAVEESEIPAQLEAMSGIDLALDLGKFAISPLNKNSRIVARAMVGSVNEIAQAALSQLSDGSMSFMHIEGSCVFDPDSLSEEVASSVKQTKIIGENTHGHSTPNNLRFNAAMAFDGLSD